MSRQSIFPEGGPRPGGSYSPGIRCGDFIFVSGQVPIDPSTGQLPGDDIESQVRQTLKNVATILAAGGASMDDVVRVDVYLADLGDFDAYDAVYKEAFSPPLPARTTVQAGLKGIKVEINVIAWVGSGSGQ